MLKALNYLWPIRFNILLKRHKTIECHYKPIIKADYFVLNNFTWWFKVPKKQIYCWKLYNVATHWSLRFYQYFPCRAHDQSCLGQSSGFLPSEVLPSPSPYPWSPVPATRQSCTCTSCPPCAVVSQALRNSWRPTSATPRPSFRASHRLINFTEPAANGRLDLPCLRQLNGQRFNVTLSLQGPVLVRQLADERIFELHTTRKARLVSVWQKYRKYVIWMVNDSSRNADVSYCFSHLDLQLNCMITSYLLIYEQ